MTYKDAASLAKPKHPKRLYVECLKDSNNWRAYAHSKRYTVEDMAMIVCKDVGCAINYCGLLKQSLPMEWEGTEDCATELTQFNNCMVAE